jgi:hypothetical protein
MGCQTVELDDLAFMSRPPECHNFGELEKAEGFIYDFFKYGALNHDFEENIPSAIRQDFLNAYQALAVEAEGSDFPDAVAHFIDEGIGTEGIWQGLLTSYGAMRAIINKPVFDFEELQAELDGLIAAAKGDADLSCAEKHVLVLVYYLTKGTFLYLEEVYSEPLASGAGGIELRDGCTELSCFFETYYGSVAIGAAAGAAAGAVGGALAGGVGAGPGALAGALTGAVGGAVRGIISGILNWGDCCSNIDCHPIAGVSLRFTGCDPVAVYRAFGFGADASLLAWENDNGTPQTAVTAAASPTLTITQTDITQDVETVVTTICNGGANLEGNLIFRNLHNLARSTGGLSLWGPLSVAPGTTHGYGLFGVSINPNVAITQWYVTNGTIVNDHGSWIEVMWDSGMATGMIQAELTNTCPGGQVSWQTLNVTGDGPIP